MHSYCHDGMSHPHSRMWLFSAFAVSALQKDIFRGVDFVA
jgi:hypothetical protein